MLTPATFQQHSAQIVNPHITPEARSALVTEVKDSFKVIHSEYPAFLHCFLPAFEVLLTEVTTPQYEHNVIQDTRATVLETLSRLPQNDVLGEKILDVYNMAMNTLSYDNETNALTALRTIKQLHKNYPQRLARHVQPFLDHVKQLFESFGNIAETCLVPVLSTPFAPAKLPTPAIPPSAKSFKVMTECISLLIDVLELYPHLVPAIVQRFLPLMVQTLQFAVPAEMIPEKPNQSFHEFIASQIKTLTLLAYLLRQCPEKMKRDNLTIPRYVVKLMQTCPGEVVGVRKELLVATRDIFASNFRRGFFDQIDILLDDRILVGTSRTCAGTLRPLAYSFLAELVHCMRLNLTAPQLQRIIFLFSANIHDPNLSYSLQTQAVRVLLNLIEGILKVNHVDANHRPAAREILIRILETFVEKYETLGEQVPELLHSVVSMRCEPDPIAIGKRLSEIPLGDPLKEITGFKTLLKTLTWGLKTVIWSAVKVGITSSNVSETALSAGLSPNSANQSVRTGLLEEEREIVARLIPAGRSCFRLYSRHEEANGAVDEIREPQPSAGSNESGKNVSSVIEDLPPTVTPDLISEYAQAAEPSRIVAASCDEEKEIIDRFALIFTVLDPPSFLAVFGLHTTDLFEYIVKDKVALIIPQVFLANDSTSKYYADITFKFLVENMKHLDVPYQDMSQEITSEGIRANCLLKLFKILFASVNLFPTNELVLRLHLHSTVENCLRCAGKAKDPHAYLEMLHALFKSVTKGKYEEQSALVYQDFVPLVEPIFAHLHGIYARPSRLPHRELIVEVCRMVPAHPLTILPYIEQQIKPIICALDEGNKNPMYELQTLEFWVDMLKPEHLPLLLARVEPNLSRALHRYLSPPRNSFRPGASRILGKLGSWSRDQVVPLIPIRQKQEDSYIERLCLDLQDGLRLNLETDDIIQSASDAILDVRERESAKFSKEHRRQAWKFLFGCFCKLLGFHEESGKSRPSKSKAPIEENLPSAFGKISTETYEPRRSELEQVDHILSRNKPTIQLVRCLLKTLLASAKISEMNEANSFVLSPEGEQQNPERAIENVCQYFALRSTRSLNITDVVRDEFCIDPACEGKNPESLLSSSVFLDALVDSISLENRIQATSGLEYLKFYVRHVIVSLDEVESVAQAENFQADAELMSTGDHRNSSGKYEDEADFGMKSTNDKADGKTPDVKVPAKKANAMDVDSPERCLGDEVNIAESAKGNRESPSPNSLLVARALEPLIDKLCYCCHGRTWNSQWAGIHGLNAVLSLTPTWVLSTSVNRPTVLRCFNALLSIGRAATDFSSDETFELVSSMLQRVIRILFKKWEAIPETGQQSSSTMSDFASNAYKILAEDLSSVSLSARRTAKMCFRAISEMEGCNICDILFGVREEILKPLRERPIRQHKVGIQIGYLCALNFCMELGEQSICNELFSTPVKEYLIVDCMHVVNANNHDPTQDVDNDFRPKYYDNKHLDLKTSRELVMLRRAVVDFLRNLSVHCSGALQATKHERIYELMISCFFQSLHSHDGEVAQSAKRGLKHAMSNHQKPKHLLQNNLRPILGNLCDYKKLTPQYIMVLNRVLELFSHCFSVNLGENLLEHLQHWTDPEELPPLKNTMVGSESEVPAAILDLFHLLPPTTSEFMEQIIHIVLKLEGVIALAAPEAAYLGLKRVLGVSTSPYRTPLLKFSNHHASAASSYFLSKLDDDRVRQLFFVMVRSTESELLCKELMKTPNRLLSTVNFSLADDAGKTRRIFTLIDILSRHNPHWLKTDTNIMLKLCSYWKVLLNAYELRQNNSRSQSLVRTVKLLAVIFIRYCRQFPEEIDMLYELVPILSIRTVCDFTFVKIFLESCVAQRPWHPHRKGILRRFLAMFKHKSQPPEALALSLKYVVTPMVKSHLQSRESEKKREGSTSRTGESLVEGGCILRGSVSSTTSSFDVAREEGPVEKGSNHIPKSSEKSATDEILDATVIQLIVTEALDHPTDVLLRQEETLSAELLQFVTVLLQYIPKEVRPYKKEIIHFGWYHLKREESIVRCRAFVNVSRFFRAYKAPARVILQVYVALLRTKQEDAHCKELIEEALDLLTPMLPLRLRHNPNDHKYPLWIRYTSKILQEEEHCVLSLVHIFQVIVRHPCLFYFARARFIPIMVNSLNEIGLNESALSVEHRRHCLDIVQLIIGWEKERCSDKTSASLRNREVFLSGVYSNKRTREDETRTPEQEVEEKLQKSCRVTCAELPTKTRKQEDSQAIVVPLARTHGTASPPSKDADDFTLSRAMVDILIGFLTQVLNSPMDPRETPILTRRCVSLLEEALSLWPVATSQTRSMTF